MAYEVTVEEGVKAVKPKPVQVDLQGEPIPEEEHGDVCPLMLTECTHGKCRWWSERFNCCQVELLEVLLKNVRNK